MSRGGFDIPDRKVHRLKAPEHTPGETSSYALGYGKGFRRGVATACLGILGGVLAWAIIFSFLLGAG